MIIYVNQYAVQRDRLKSDLKFQKRALSIDTCIFTKVSPYDIYSKYLNWFYTRIDDSYSFTGIRGFGIWKTSQVIAVLDLVAMFFPQEVKADFTVFSALKNQKNWYRVFLKGLPVLVIQIQKKSKVFIYTIFFPGSPAKPISAFSKDSLPYQLTMHWPKVEDSQEFLKDNIFPTLINNFQTSLNQQGALTQIQIIDNTVNIGQNVLYSFKPFKRALERYNSEYTYFSPLINTLFIKRDIDINISYSLKKQFCYFSKRVVISDFVRKVFFPKGTLLRFLYTPVAYKIDSVTDCHAFAAKLSEYLQNILPGTSYYQIAFDSPTFNLNNTLAYGHNTPKEKFAVGKSQIYFYFNDKPIRLGIYSKGLFLLTVPEKIELLYQSQKISSLDLLNILTEFILNY